MSLTATDYVFLANAVYEAPDKRKAIESLSTASEQRVDSNDYKVLEGDADYMVFQKQSTGSIVVACRGTANLTDAIPDLFIATGLLRLHPRSRKILNAVDRYKNLFRDVSVTGHSLGGKLAALIGASEGVLAVTFNQGSSPIDSNPIVTEIQEDVYNYDYKNVIHFTTCTDFVSTTECIQQNNQTIKIDPPSMINPLANHGLGNFFNIDQEGTAEIAERQTYLKKKRSEEAPEDKSLDRKAEAMEDLRNALNAYRMNKAWFDRNVFTDEQTTEVEKLMYQDAERGIDGIDLDEFTKLEDFKIFIEGIDNAGNVERAMQYFDTAVEEGLSVTEATSRTIQTMHDKGLDLDLAKFQQRIQERAESYDGALDGFDRDIIDPDVVPDGVLSGQDAIDSKMNDPSSIHFADMTEDEWAAKLMEGVEELPDAAAKLERFKENLKSLEGVAPPEFIDEATVAIGKMSAIEKLAGMLENIGLAETAAAMRGAAGRISTALAERVTTFMNMERTITVGITALSPAYTVTIRMGNVVKGVLKCLDVVTIAVMGGLLVNEIVELVISAGEIEKMKAMMTNPDLSFLRFRVEAALNRVEILQTYRSVKAGLHATELLIGILVTALAPYAAGPVWVGIGVSQLAEIPIDAFLSDQLKRHFVERWYGSADDPQIMRYILNRDVDANNHGETNDVGQWIDWVVSGMSIDSFNFEGDLQTRLSTVQGNLWQQVSAIIEDPSSVPGITDDRYDRLLVLRSRYPQTYWNNMTNRLAHERVAGYEGVPDSLTAQVINSAEDDSIIDRLFTHGKDIDRGPRSVQSYNDEVNFLKLKKNEYMWTSQYSDNGFEQDYIDAGNKPKGDRETDEEYKTRINRWTHERIKKDVRAASTFVDPQAEEDEKSSFWEAEKRQAESAGRTWTGPSNTYTDPGPTVDDDDGSYCVRVRKKSKLVTTSDTLSY
jgi:hypothetical protein